MRALLVACVLVACSSEDAPAVDGGTTTDTRAADAPIDTAIDCSTVGCAPPPPCGQPCKEVCGCCTDPTCADTGGADGG